MATVKQNPAHLFLVELHVLKIGNPLMRDRLAIQQTVDDPSFIDMDVNDFGDIFRLHPTIEGAFRIDNHNRTHFAETMTAGLDDLDLGGQSFLLQLFPQNIHHLFGSGGSTSRTAANEYM